MDAIPQDGVFALPDFQAWLNRAAPGEKLEYYRGDLAHDRECKNKSRQNKNGHHYNAAPCGNCERCVLNRYATMILTYGDGNQPRVHLVQRKNGKSDYSYLAIKSAGP